MLILMLQRNILPLKKKTYYLLVESGVIVKVTQNALGHSDIQTTLNIYADVTKELKQKQFVQFDDFITSNE